MLLETNKSLAAVPVVWRDQPFVGKPVREFIPEGRTIGEIIEYAKDRLPVAFQERGIVCINGEIVPRGAWHLVKPKAKGKVPVTVTLHVPMAGGGGGGKGKSIFGWIGAIVLMVATFWIGGGALGGLLGIEALGAGTIGAKLAAAGLAIVGSLALNSLSPPPVQPGNAPNVGGGDGREPASISGNVLQPGATLPRVMGTHRIYPPFICEPLTERINDDEYAEVVAALAGPHSLEDIKLGDTPITDIPGATYSIREGWESDLPLSLVRRQSRTQGVQLTLSQHEVDPANPTRLLNQGDPAACSPQWHSLYSRNEPDEIWLGHVWSEGLFRGDAPTTKVAMPVRYRIRKKGDANWINLPEIHFTNRKASYFEKTVKLIWGATPSPLPVPLTDEAPYLAFKTVPAQVDPAIGGWTADAYFSAVGDAHFSAANVGTTGVKNVAMYADRVEFYLDVATFPKGVYEIQVRRGTMYNAASLVPATYFYNNGTLNQVWDFFGYEFTTPYYVVHTSAANTHQKLMISRVSSIWNEPVITQKGYALIELRLRNRRVDQLSVLASGFVKDWNPETAAWDTYVKTTNPAPHYREVLTGRNSADPLPPELVDNDNLLAWRQECETSGHEVSFVAEGTSTNEVIQALASAGYARGRASETWGVVMDRDRTAEAPVQVFTPNNLSAFRWQKAFPRKPTGIRAKFRNRDKDYADDEMIIPDGVSSADRLEEISYPGRVDPDAVRARALFDWNQIDARSTFYYGETDIEALVCRNGDLVGLQHDILMQKAGFARVRGVIRDEGDPTLILGVSLDAKLPTSQSAFFAAENAFLKTPRKFFADARTGIVLRTLGNSIVTKEISVSEHESDVVLFTTPLSDPDYDEDIELSRPLLDRGCLVASGPLGQEYKRVVILDITFRKHMTAALTFVDEAPELFAA